MDIQKELPLISWQVPESTYRADPALSYSTLSRYEREGFNKLDSLFESISSQSLLEGSMVDCLITGSIDEFNTLYYVADFPSLGDKEQLIADTLFERYGAHYPEQYAEIGFLPFSDILNVIQEFDYQKRWKDETRVTVLSQHIAQYYSHKIHAQGKTIVDLDTYNKVQAMVNSLKTNPSTCGYFADNDPLSPVRRYYQLKFKARFENVNYRCMADLIIVDYESKKIYPIDLKTSGHKEWDFQDSFKQWNYMIQARLYWRIIRANMLKDPYFKDFTLEDYKFIVINKFSLTPLVWEFPLTKSVGTLIDDNGTEFRDPFVIGTELQGYLNLRPQVPNGIDKDGTNLITTLHKKPT